MAKKIWTEEKLKEGFNRFLEEKGHFPTAPEIDAYPFLPSSRSIQRSNGGLVNLRKLFGFEVSDYSRGGYRSKLAGIYNIEGRVSEEEVGKYLGNRYGEICVHEEKRYGDGKNTMDFFVYAKENFGVDVFKTSSYQNLAKNINIKLGKYNDFPYKLYFVVIGKDFDQGKIDAMMIHKKDKPMLNNMKCLTFQMFMNECKSIEPLNMDIQYTKVDEY